MLYGVMLYGVTVSGNDLKVFEAKLGTLGKIVHRSRHFIVFHSENDWDFLRKQFPDNIISKFNPRCALGKEIVWNMERKRKAVDE